MFTPVRSPRVFPGAQARETPVSSNGGRLTFVAVRKTRSSQRVSNLRNLYRYLPFARSTYRHATAIIAASSQTYSEFAAYRDKLFFVPEPGIARSQCADDSRSPE